MRIFIQMRRKGIALNKVASKEERVGALPSQIDRYYLGVSPNLARGAAPGRSLSLSHLGTSPFRCADE